MVDAVCVAHVFCWRSLQSSPLPRLSLGRDAGDGGGAWRHSDDRITKTVKEDHLISLLATVFINSALGSAVYLEMTKSISVLSSYGDTVLQMGLIDRSCTVKY